MTLLRATDVLSCFQLGKDDFDFQICFKYVIIDMRIFCHHCTCIGLIWNVLTEFMIVLNVTIRAYISLQQWPSGWAFVHFQLDTPYQRDQYISQQLQNHYCLEINAPLIVILWHFMLKSCFWYFVLLDTESVIPVDKLKYVILPYTQGKDCSNTCTHSEMTAGPLFMVDHIWKQVAVRNVIFQIILVM